MQIRVIRIDNVAKLKSLLKEWSNKYRLTYQPTILYKSNQNRIAKRTIQQTKNNARAILAKAKLPIEFWDKVVEANIYLQNQLPRREEL